MKAKWCKAGKAGRFRPDEHDTVGDFLGEAESPQRDLPGKNRLVLCRLGETGEHAGVRRAGRDGIHANSRLGDFERHRLGEGLADGVRRITAGKGVDIAIESIGGALTSEALSSLALGGVLITLGYSAGRKTTIDVTDLIWKGAQMFGFSLFAQSPTAIANAWRDIIPLIVGGSAKPIVERVYPLGEASLALRHLTEDRPFGKVVLAG